MKHLKLETSNTHKDILLKITQNIFSLEIYFTEIIHLMKICFQYVLTHSYYRYRKDALNLSLQSLIFLWQYGNYFISYKLTFINTKYADIINNGRIL